ncbi:hypothetical protein MMC18_006520 [Xylographa bjoerkii]|nr:hypothetical protein [Xylographa bjoerkii]
MATPTSLSRLITTEWIDGNSIKRSQPVASDEDFVNLDFAEELYGTLLSVFAQICRTCAKTFSSSKQRQNKEALGRLHLWGRDFQGGKLACILAQSDDLRDTVIDLLGQIGRVVLDLADVDGCDNEFAEQVRSLKTLIDRSRLIITASDSSNSESDDDSISELRTKRGNRPRENGSARQKYQFGSVEERKDSGPGLEQLEKDLEPNTRGRPPTSRIDGPCIYTPESSEDEDEGSDYGTLLECHIDCLMDLIPTMEQSLAHLQSGGIQTKTPSRVPFLVSELALPWVQNVSDKFTSADNALIKRLGEANWQRYMTLRARTEQKIQSLDIDDGVAHNFPAVQIFQTAPQSIFKPLSLFHDSGMGSSVPTLPRYASSAASHTSFLSSLADDSALSLRVPPTPVEVDSGDPFKCEICGHVLSNIKNRVDWKIHVFADLQPYICTFESCAKELITFPTRNLWGSHEFEEHRITRSWKCPECAYVDSTAQKLEEHLRKSHGEAVTLAQLPLIIAAAETKTPLAMEDQECPLCKAIPGKSRRNFVKHVGRHMESVALAVLPRDAAEDSDQSSDCSIVAQDEEPNSTETINEPKEHYFFVPPDFQFDADIGGRDKELRLLHEGLFAERRKHGTDSVLLHGQPWSGKVRLVQHYISLNIRKFPGGIFWINGKSNQEFQASLLMIARTYIWETYKSGAGININSLASIVTAWFVARNGWLIVLNDLASRWDSARKAFQPLWPVLAPDSRCSSLIYISSSDGITSLKLPLDPIPLEIRPLRNTEQQNPRQNNETNTSSTNLGTGELVQPLPTISTEASITLEASMQAVNGEVKRHDTAAHGDSRTIPNFHRGEAYDPTGVQGRGRLSGYELERRKKLQAIIHDSDEEDRQRSDYEPQVRSPVGTIPMSMYHPDKPYTPSVPTRLGESFSQLFENPPQTMPDQSRLSGLGLSQDSSSTSNSPSPRMQVEGLFDPVKSRLLMQALPCEHQGCSVISKSISAYTEHCEASHGEILADMSKNLSDIRADTMKTQDQWLLEQPAITPTQTPRLKLITQNLSAELFQNKQIHNTELLPSGHEYKPRLYDEAGDKKLASDGRLLGGRSYRTRTFLVQGKGDTLFMLATECARVLGYRDSYLLFNKNRCLYKIILDQAGKDDLIYQEILPFSYRSRQIAIVTARSMFREFGSRIVANGRRVRDDYWEAKARTQGFTEDDMASSKVPGGHLLKMQVAKDALTPLGENVQLNGEVFPTITNHDYQMRLMLLEQSNKPSTAVTTAPLQHDRLSFGEASDDPIRDSDKQGLSDYQMQLMLLEQQRNKRHLLSERSNKRTATIATVPLQHDRFSSEQASGDSIAAPDKENQRTPQQNQEGALQQKAQHKCPHCSKVFSRHHNLKTHLLTHNDETPYVCQTCDSGFRRLLDLKRHAKLHTRERPCICWICKRVFARPDALERHTMGSGGCAGRQSTTDTLESSEGELMSNENKETLDLDRLMEPEYAGSEAQDPIKAPEAAYSLVTDRPQSDPDTSRDIYYRGTCRRCRHYHLARFIGFSTIIDGHTIIECDSCALPIVLLESELFSAPMHYGPWKCYKPECVLLENFTNVSKLQSHQRAVHHEEDASLRWFEEKRIPGTTKHETQMSLARPYKCNETSCNMLQGFSSRHDLQRHYQEIHKPTGTASLEQSPPKAVSPSPETDPNKGDIIRCVCGQEDYPGLGKSAQDALKSRTYHNRTSTSFLTIDPEYLRRLLMQCDTCKVWQHGNCVGIQNAASCPDKYFCEQCRPQNHPIRSRISTRRAFSSYRVNSASTRSEIHQPPQDTKGGVTQRASSPPRQDMFASSLQTPRRSYQWHGRSNKSNAAPLTRGDKSLDWDTISD